MSDATVSSYFSNLFSNQSSRNAFFLGSIALGSSVATAAAIFGAQRLSRTKKRKDLGDSIKNAANNQAERRLDPNLAHPRDESSSSTTDAATPRYLANLSANQLRPSSDLRHSHSFNTSTSVPPLVTPSRKHGGGGRASTSSAYDQPEWDETLIREQLSRNYSFLGDDGMDKVRNAFVIVVGAGGVGSWAAMMLLRSGVGKLRLIDFDQVSLSSLNRHACANLADVGRPKVVCCAEKFAQIAPWATLEAWVELFRGDEAPRLLGGNPTYVVDAIDNIDTKVELLKYCAENRIKVISSMGAGAKSDPSRIQISDISTTSEDPLARSVRRRLRALGLPPLPPKEAEDAAAGAGNKKDKVVGADGNAPSSKKAKGGKGGKATAGGAADDGNKSAPVKAVSTAAPGGPGGKGSDSAGDGEVSPNRFLASGGTMASGKTRTPLVPSPLGGSPMQLSHILPPSTAVPPTLPNIRKDHSRRASSVSSMGSGVYATPLTTPSDEMAALLPPDQQDEWALLDGGNGDAAEEITDAADARPFSLGEAAIEPREKNEEDEAKEVLIDETKVPEEVLVDEASAVSGVSSPQAVIQPPPPSSFEKSRHVSRTSELEEIAPGSTNSSPAVSRSTSYRDGPSIASTTNTTTSIDEDDDRVPEPTYFIPCVYSTEKSDTRLLPLDEEEFQRGSVDELAALEDFRVRILPVLGPLPAMFGLAVATFIICEVAGHKMEPLAFKGRKKLYEKITSDLSVTESRHHLPGTVPSVSPGGAPRQHIPFSVTDVSYLFEEVFRGRSVVPPFESLSGAQLERWDSTLPLSYSNVALFSRAEAKVHEREVLKKGRSPKEIWGSETARMVKRRMAEQRVSGFFR